MFENALMGHQMSGLLNPQQPKPTGTGLLGLLGDPRLMIAMNLLSAGRDSRIDPFQSALSGLMQAQQFRNASDDRERVQAEEERKQAEAERKAWEHKQRVELSERMAALGRGMAGQLRGPNYGAPLQGPPTPDGTMPTVGTSPQNEMMAALYETDPRMALEYGLKRDKLNYDKRNEMRDKPIGVPFKGDNGNMWLTVQNADGNITSLDTGGSYKEDVPPQVLKMVYDAASEYQDNVRQASDAGRLSRLFDENKDQFVGGTREQGQELWKRLVGGEDQLSLLRYEWIGLRNSLAVGMLPPGVASDNDIALIMSGFPDDFSNPEIVSQYLKARERVLLGLAKWNRFKSSYMTENQSPLGMLDAWEKLQGTGQPLDARVKEALNK